MQPHPVLGDGVILSQPRPSGAFSAAGFAVCPAPLRPWVGMPDGWVQEVYRLAYEQARAALLPPWHERSLLASPN
jgi:hypothetical protein